MVVQMEWMSGYKHDCIGVFGVHNEVEKLVPSLRTKEHYGNLHLYLSQRMHLKKMHRALHFEQNPWTEPYILMNTELQKKAITNFENNNNKKISRRTILSLGRQ